MEDKCSSPQYIPQRTQSSLKSSIRLNQSQSPNKVRRLSQCNIDIPQQIKYPPILSGQAWCIHDQISGKILGSKQETQQMEIASLTKIMTAVVSYQLSQKFELNISEYVLVSQEATWLGGTSAFLPKGFQINLSDLFYAMLLPSGNDAALTFALYFGEKLIQQKKKNSQVKPNNTNFIIYFVKEMNKTAKKLIMNRTQYKNPHGLSDKGNLSCAEDQGKLGLYFMKIPFLAKVVNTIQYETQLKNKKDELVTFKWKNTNLMLEIEGWKGLKTGHTPNAGPCLLGCYIKNNLNIIITILKTKTPDHRWKEVDLLKDWAASELADTFQLKSFIQLQIPCQNN